MFYSCSSEKTLTLSKFLTCYFNFEKNLEMKGFESRTLGYKSWDNEQPFNFPKTLNFIFLTMRLKMDVRTCTIMLGTKGYQLPKLLSFNKTKVKQKLNACVFSPKQSLIDLEVRRQ